MPSPAGGGAAAAGWAAALAWLALSSAVGAQEEAPRGRGCTLVLEPATDSTRSVRVQEGPNRYVTYVGNGIRAVCGDARMDSDSAVSYGGEERVRMIGAVDYRDSVRTLTADTLTYFQAEDRVLAVGDVVLVRRASGSRLTGPTVEFLRVRSPEDRRTVATGRSRLLVFPDSAARDPAARDTASPVEVDADRIVMLGEREVRTRGDVRIRRPGMDARSDSAHFRVDAGTGRLMGSPRVDGERFTLTGDTILTGFEEGELREVESVSDARATGEDFDLHAARIRARMADEELDRLWAHGEGRSVALSAPYRLAADSLDTAFAAGEMDTLYAVGDARAVEIGGEGPEGDPRAPIALTADGRSWISGDTLVFSFARPEDASPAEAAADSAGAGIAGADTMGADTAGAAEGAEGAPPAEEEVTGDAAAAAGSDGESRLEHVRASGEARAYHVLEPAESGEPPARDYQMARIIDIYFEDGEVARVVGQQAVGVHLDPMEGAGGPPPSPPDTAGLGPPPEEARPDTAAGAAPDTAAGEEEGP